VKKWTGVALALALLACAKRPATGSALTGATSPRRAVEMFLAAVKAQDLQAMSVVWGTDKGPARDQMERTELDKREIIMQACYEHDRYEIVREAPAPNGERFVSVAITRGQTTKTPNFVAVKGPSDRWYVRDADYGAMRCRTP
jgi:hypothetical protein